MSEQVEGKREQRLNPAAEDAGVNAGGQAGKSTRTERLHRRRGTTPPTPKDGAAVDVAHEGTPALYDDLSGGTASGGAGFEVNAIGQHLVGIFQVLAAGVVDACEHLGADNGIKKDKGLLELAAVAAINTMAHLVGSWVAIAFRDLFDQESISKGLYNTTRATFRAAIERGADESAKIDMAHALATFRELQLAKLRAAQAHAVTGYWREIAPVLQGFPVERLQAITDAAEAVQQQPEAAATQHRHTVIEWVNYVARAAHGAGDGQSIDPTKAAGLLDISQRPFVDEHHGILEVSMDVSGDGTGSARRFRYSLHSISMEGVQPHAKATLRTLGTVGQAPVNKVIRVFPGGHTLNPPKPERTILVGPDGSILRSDSSWDGDYGTPEQIVAWANGLSIGGLE
jgi:hypothetical protein